MSSDEPRLDPEFATQPQLRRAPPDVLAPPTTDTFSVVVLSFDNHVPRQRRRAALAAMRGDWPLDSRRQSLRPCPFVLCRGLLLADAQLAQFELICEDICSVFIADRVSEGALPEYLAQLYRELLTGSEFARVRVRVESLPDNEEGREFWNRYLSGWRAPLPCELVVARKKARFMHQAAARIGGKINQPAQ